MVGSRLAPGQKHAEQEGIRLLDLYRAFLHQTVDIIEEPPQGAFADTAGPVIREIRNKCQGLFCSVA